MKVILILAGKQAKYSHCGHKLSYRKYDNFGSQNEQTLGAFKLLRLQFPIKNILKNS